VAAAGAARSTAQRGPRRSGQAAQEGGRRRQGGQGEGLGKGGLWQAEEGIQMRQIRTREFSSSQTKSASASRMMHLSNFHQSRVKEAHMIRYIARRNGRFTRLLPTTLVFAMLALAPASGRASMIGRAIPQVPFRGCYIYQHIDFQGGRGNIPLGEPLKVLGHAWNDKISSIACSEGCGLQVWEHAGFGGTKKTFWGLTAYVGNAWNDQISSVAAVCQ
jgi:hypothetical protein